MTPEIVPFTAVAIEKHWFNMPVVNNLLVQYCLTGCTSVSLRDQIMAECKALIEKTIKRGKYYQCTGQGDSDIELFQIGWAGIEKALYKFRANVYCYYHYYNPETNSRSTILKNVDQTSYGVVRPEELEGMGCKCKMCGKLPDKVVYKASNSLFSMIYTTCRQQMAAYTKKYLSDVTERTARPQKVHDKFYKNRRPKIDYQAFIKQVVQRYDNYIKILDAVDKLGIVDSKTYFGSVDYLVRETGISQVIIKNFQSWYFGSSSDHLEPKVESHRIWMTKKYQNSIKILEDRIAAVPTYSTSHRAQSARKIPKWKAGIKKYQDKIKAENELAKDKTYRLFEQFLRDTRRRVLLFKSCAAKLSELRVEDWDKNKGVFTHLYSGANMPKPVHYFIEDLRARQSELEIDLPWEESEFSSANDFR